MPRTYCGRPNSKYHAQSSRVGGRFFSSNMERARAAELELQQSARAIRDLTYQPRLELEPGIFYRPDFYYVECETGRKVHEDVKGFEGERWRVIQKLWALHGPTVLRVTTQRRGRFVVRKEILPCG